ncbi:MAG: hypothetical protein IPK93_02470 [Solirubrobacterales bacterium]|nr:hypothetical protein [Solirubrobacterales bacterium]
MANSLRYLRLSLALALAAATTMMMLLGGNVKQADAAEGVCPTFRVLHNDRIGALSLPRGTYNVTTLDSARLSCASASKLFSRFLQDYDGKLQTPWIVNAAAKSFTKGRGSTTGFKVAKTRGGGTPGTTTPASCPGYFRVLHNDSIGNFKVPAGRYRLSLINPRKRLTCKKAAVNFSEFLQDFDGKLVSPEAQEVECDFLQEHQPEDRLQYQQGLRPGSGAEALPQVRPLPRHFPGPAQRPHRQAPPSAGSVLHHRQNKDLADLPRRRESLRPVPAAH